MPNDSAEAGGREEVELFRRAQVAQRDAELPADELLADVFERPHALLLSTPEQRVDDLEQQIFQEIRVLLIHAGRDEQLPRAFGAVLDRMQQVRLARSFVADHRHNFRMRARVAAVQVHHAEELIALLRKELGNVIAGTILVIGIAGIAYWEDQQRKAELADIDAAMMSDSLPIDAYLDHGFNAYLTRNH